MPQLELRDKVQPQYPLMCLPSPTQEVLVGSSMPHKKAFRLGGIEKRGKGRGREMVVIQEFWTWEAPLGQSFVGNPQKMQHNLKCSQSSLRTAQPETSPWHCQFDRVWSHLGDKPLSLSGRGFLD